MSETDNKMLEWLHSVTIIAYEKDFIISSWHMNYVRSLYEQGYTPEQAVKEFIIYKKTI